MGFAAAKTQHSLNFSLFAKLAIVQILWLLTILFIITLFRTRFFRQIFARFSNTSISKTQQLIFSGCLVGALAGYERLFRYMGRISIKDSVGGTSGLFFWLWCVGILIILRIARSLIKRNKIWLNNWIWISILAILIRSSSKISFWESLGSVFILIPYYLVLAYAEELLKFSLAQYEENTENQTSISQLLALSLSVAFAFALTENSLALILMLLGENEVSSGFLIGRGLIATMVHLLATGAIALILLKLRKVNRYLSYPLALGVGFLIHSIYNLGHAFGMGTISFVIAVWGFFGLSYLLYHLDELYLDDKNGK